MDADSGITARIRVAFALRQFNRSGGRAGIGLAGMRERLRELGGRLEVESEGPIEFDVAIV
jgi:signal transduction histidine kinase